ncbi:histidinol-phosphate aminotransferase [Bacillus pakistanensis]|uniref:Histidinol-phosphate aminotransferase n=1 Tax=Rossellomorea pakistanensis TaxID=992288 RepID=A0ABS2NJ52_9BACI|nr:histidinol-phosphate transaminase [Bacillus pakistanensis]MBM7587830.1 histidinol-phosphate aminotransferase [Bacillus pakistanensis]
MVVKFKTRKRVEAIAPYVLGKSLEEIKIENGLSQIRKLSENENIYGCSPEVKKWISFEGSDLNLYPDGMAVELTKKVSDFFKVDQDQLVFGNGSDEVIRLLTRAYISEGEEAIMADVTFPRYQTNVYLEGGTPVIVPLENGIHHLENMLEAITKKTKMIFVCNPNNPTGTIVGRDELLSFIKKVPEHILVVIDEAYVEYVSTDDFLHTVPLVEQFENLIVLRTFSKIYGLAGLRIGFGIMNKEITEQLRKVKDVFNVSRLAQGAARVALEDQAFIKKCSENNLKGRKFLEGSFQKMGLNYFPSQSNFIMVDCEQNGDVVARGLMKKGIIVRSGTLLGYPTTLRVTIGSDEDNHYFIESLTQVLKGV